MLEGGEEPTCFHPGGEECGALRPKEQVRKYHDMEQVYNEVCSDLWINNTIFIIKKLNNSLCAFAIKWLFFKDTCLVFNIT